jgi:hypothetical protein
MLSVSMSKMRLNPALKSLKPFVGDWDMELSRASFLLGPQTKLHGPASFKWVEKGAFLVMYQGGKRNPEATWLIGRDESTDSYKVLYFVARGVSRVYEMSFKDNEWKMWRDSPGFSQRFRGLVSKDRKIIRAEWKKSEDGKKWEHDFDITYTKMK